MAPRLGHCLCHAHTPVNFLRHSDDAVLLDELNLNDPK